MIEYPTPIASLIDKLSSLPGVGRKSAQRIAFHLLDASKEECDALINSIKEAKEKIHYCPVCQSFTDSEICAICASQKRDDSVICVVAGPKDVSAIEKTNEFHGKYHVLHGVISPMDGIGPDSLKIKELLERVNNCDIKEIILAVGSTVEAEATAMYISRLIKPLGITVSKIAYGLPVGGDLEFADEVTLAKAIEGRNAL